MSLGSQIVKTYLWSRFTLESVILLWWLLSLTGLDQTALTAILDFHNLSFWIFSDYNRGGSLRLREVDEEQIQVSQIQKSTPQEAGISARTNHYGGVQHRNVSGSHNIYRRGWACGIWNYCYIVYFFANYRRNAFHKISFLSLYRGWNTIEQNLLRSSHHQAKNCQISNTVTSHASFKECYHFSTD